MFVCKLKKLRSDHNISQRELSEKTGIRYPTISEMERCATKSCSLENLDKLCRLFKCTLNDIYEFSPIQSNEITIPLEVDENGKVDPFVEYTPADKTGKSTDAEIKANQINVLEDIFYSLDPISQGKLLVFADELRKQSNEG